MAIFNIYFRVLFKNKLLSFINLTGLSLGISSCLFISLFLFDELNYDFHHTNIHRIFRISSKIVTEASVDKIAISSRRLAETIKQTFPEVEEAARFGVEDKVLTIRKDDDLYKETDVCKADPAIFRIFTYPFLQGDPRHALDEPLRVVLTRSTAEKYFGHEDALGKMLTIGMRDFQVTGVMEDLPSNSDLKISLLMSMDSTDNSDDWFDFSYYSYVLFSEKQKLTPAFIAGFEKKLQAVVEDKLNRPLRENKQAMVISHWFQPLNGLHFEESLLYDTPKGNRDYIIVLSCVAFLILLIGCLNYINFSIVQSLERSKEVGIRKIVGASFLQLVWRYICESFLFTLFALIAAVAITILMMPFFNEVTSKSFTAAVLLDSRILVVMVSLLFMVGLLAGSYPAFYTSAIKPVLALKGKVTTPKGQVIRKVSIAMQFFISIGLMSATLIVYNQMSFIKNYDLGFRKDNVVVFTAPTDTTLHASLEVLKQNLLRNPGIKAVALGGWGSVPGDSPQLGSHGFRSDGKDEVRMTSAIHVDEDYLPSLGIEIVEGRNFNGSLNDFRHSALVNEALVKMMGWKNPLEQKAYGRKGQLLDIIGVVRDFHFLSLYNTVGPTVITYHNKEIISLFVVLEGASLSHQFEVIRDEWEKVYPNEPFLYKFLDESVNAQYEKEERAMEVFTYFSVLTLSISCLGLFGLSSLTVYQRKREIGIRKIVGADFASIATLFAKEYLALIFLAIIVVSPVCWYLMNNWLETFPFRTTINVFVFVSIGISVLLISLFTIIFSVSKISKTTPINLIAE